MKLAMLDFNVLSMYAPAKEMQNPETSIYMNPTLEFKSVLEET